MLRTGDKTNGGRKNDGLGKGQGQVSHLFSSLPAVDFAAALARLSPQNEWVSRL